ncbi:MAG: hypothetical protein ACLFQX_00615 [Candidatus Kapaibacterium sp.]
MKKAIIILIISIFGGQNLMQAADNFENPVGKTDSDGIGWYISLDNNYTTINDKLSFTLGARGAIKISDYLAVGIAGSAIWYDHRLNDLDPDRTYHLEGGYAGFYIEPMLPIGDNFMLSMQIVFANGFAQFKYDSKYNKELTWTEEIIDRDEFGVFEPTLHAQYMLGDNWALGANVSMRSTSPMEMLGAGEGMLNNVSFGFSVKYVNF